MSSEPGAGQFPVSPVRIIFAASGTLPCALVVRDERAVIEHAAYWSAVESQGEGNYLATVLNSETARSKVAGHQAQGQWGARHFDKLMFTLPIPRFDPNNDLHQELAALGAEAEQIASRVELEEGTHFQTARRMVRNALVESRVSARIDRLVASLLARRRINGGSP